MAIARVAIPTPTSPGLLSDYQSILDQIAGSTQAFTGREIVDGSTIRAGTLMLIGGVLYKATSDTSITGSASDYVKITPSGASATAAFVSSLTGVTFNEAYGGYYDGSGNLHVFDEGKAVAAGTITAPRTRMGMSAGPRMRTFTASGTFIVPTGVTRVWVTGCAAGGNGGSGSSTTTTPGGGGGGGQGASCIKKAIAVTPGASITVTIGAVGANTTFGALLTLAFGSNGSGGSGNVSGTGGPGAGSGNSNADLLGGKQGGRSGQGGAGGGGAQSPIPSGDAGAAGANAGVNTGGAGGVNGGGGGGAGASTGSGAGGVGGAATAYGAGGGGGGGGDGSGGTGAAGGAGGPAILTIEW